MGKLDGRTALITGAARGQGRSHALTLAAEGANVVAVDLCADLATIPYPLATPEDLAATKAQVEALGGACHTVRCDVRDTEAMEAVVADAVDRFGALDIAVANAGVCGFAKFWDLDDAAWDEMIGVDLTGVFKTMRAAVRPMLRQGHGRIVATSSMGGRMGNPNLAHYVAAKWGVIGLVKTLALEAASSGITVNAVCPATVDTAMVHNDALYGLFCPDLDAPTREQVEPAYAAMSPMGVPWVAPEDISKAVLYLVSDDARYISGTTIDVSTAASAGMP
ncbi:mycofactocin-coupled SDR family oxidoreductase [Nocardioides carbamazepini]|uniref:mycofactocin-coupled SDR family oxidoreductase n=1 Tax=Nocardioides carbamazepini TaxID=2854259 RepID=UPI00214A2034|nr:mycofactocin-coupled SDR family oxidoreductase [Nocardioides carbamazepini]MCR1783927.1 mycofactocin-coupled SDR family oxidoreductase [Nocardioides carbamazepini]